MDSQDDNTTLVKLLAAGDEAAWRRFMADFGGLIFLISKRMGLTETEREEVFQETCLSVYRFIDTLRDPSKLPFWTQTIARRHALNLLRHRNPDLFLEEPAVLEWVGEHDSEAARALDLALKIQRSGRLTRALSRLDERCRRLLHAIYQDPGRPTYAEIARRERLPIGSIGPTRARCLQKLRKFLVSAGVSAESIG